MQVEKTIGDFPDEVGEVYRFALQLQHTGADAADVEQALDERSYAIELNLEFSQQAANIGWRSGRGSIREPVKKLEGELKHVQRIAQLVRGDSDERVARGDGIGETGLDFLSRAHFFAQDVDLIVQRGEAAAA